MSSQVYIRRDPLNAKRIVETARTSVDPGEGWEKVVGFPAAFALAKRGGAAYWFDGSSVRERIQVELRASAADTPFPGPIMITPFGVPDFVDALDVVVNGTDTVTLLRDPVTSEIEQLQLEWDQPALVKVAVSEDHVELMASPLYVRFEDPNA